MLRAHLNGPSILAAALLLPSLPSQVAVASPLLSVVDHQSDVATLGPLDVLLSPEGRHLYLVGDSSLTVLERDPVTGSTRFLESHFEGRGGVGALRDASSLAISGDGRFLYTASPFHPGKDGVERAAVAIFERDVTTGLLRFEGVHTEDFEGAGLSFPGASVAISSEGAHLYVASAPDEAVLTFERDPATGRLSFLAAIGRGLRGAPGRNSLSFGPQGSYLYMTNQARGSITVFERDPLNGLLKVVQDLMSDDPDYDRVFPVFPVSLAVSPDGRYAYVTNRSVFPFDSPEGAIVSFRRNPATGRLRVPREEICQVSPNRIRMSADGAFLYVPGLRRGPSVALRNDDGRRLRRRPLGLRPGRRLCPRQHHRKARAGRPCAEFRRLRSGRRRAESRRPSRLHGDGSFPISGAPGLHPIAFHRAARRKDGRARPGAGPRTPEGQQLGGGEPRRRLRLRAWHLRALTSVRRRRRGGLGPRARRRHRRGAIGALPDARPCGPLRRPAAS